MLDIIINGISVTGYMQRAEIRRTGAYHQTRLVLEIELVLPAEVRPEDLQDTQPTLPPSQRRIGP